MKPWQMFFGGMLAFALGTMGGVLGGLLLSEPVSVHELREEVLSLRHEVVTLRVEVSTIHPGAK